MRVNILLGLVNGVWGAVVVFIIFRFIVSMFSNGLWTVYREVNVSF